MKKKLLRNVFSIFNRFIPKNRFFISLYGRRMFNENLEALLDYLINKNYNSKYKILINISPNVSLVKYDNINNIRIIHNPIFTLFYLFRSKFIFHTHGMTSCSFKPKRSQIIFNLWHGSPLKLIGAAAGSNWNPETDSYFLCASPFMSEINKRCFLLKDEQIFIGSNPRNDILLKPYSSPFINQLKGNKKLILFMPTFRNSNELGEHDAESDFPILNQNNIKLFDDYLDGKNIIFVIKPHPYQNDISLFKIKYRNIVIVKNDDIHHNNDSLYNLLGNSDALISDFSSVYFDYLLLNRPIAFAIDDFEDYKSNRGFTVENPMEIMPGYKLKKYNDLIEFINNILRNNDPYKAQRKKICKLCNAFNSPDSSKRILDFVGIQK